MSSATNFILSGRVQGVGFRPFVYQLAHEIGVKGWVRNTVGRVEIHAECDQDNLMVFRRALIQQAPPLSQPEIEEELPAEDQHTDGFYILRSEATGDAAIHVPADQYLCPDCEHELSDLNNRRYRYPFINCTQCGPRYTIIHAMPYDRANTSMDRFKLCKPCHKEYTTAGDRRFHAEPNACPDCGPHLSYADPETSVVENSELALNAAVKALRHGRIIAMKGVGGYHLICDAANEVAVTRLRKNKHRPHKPLALMVPRQGADDLDNIRQLVELEDNAALELKSQQRPIVLLKKNIRTFVCEAVAPGLNEIGVMLPSSPLHDLLLAAFAKPIVATSGNISGEPVLTDDEEAGARLSHVAEAWLTHNREIVRPADDTVKRYIAKRPRLIRLGRGSAPVEHKLLKPLPYPTLAVGGHLKNTIALAWDDRLIVSPHIGDLSAHRSQNIFEQVIHDLQDLYQAQASVILHDLHPHYASTHWANGQGLPLHPIQHHRAHASALAGEHQRHDTDSRSGLVFAWDGVGLGDDGSLWGGETFIGRPGHWQRVSSFRPFRLLGGDRVSREPWRSAAALHWEIDEPYSGTEPEKLAHAAWLSGLNVIPSSAAGRLFDAAAAMLGLVHEASYEGQGPMQLEAVAEPIETTDCLPLYKGSADKEHLQLIDWQPLLEELNNPAKSVAKRAGYFHRVLANTILAITQAQQQSHEIDYVGLTGGVFQNRLLTELVVAQLRKNNIECLLHTSIPANDGGLCYGQIIEYQAQIK